MSITKIKSHATRISKGNAKVKPGQPARLTSASKPTTATERGDGVWQGDLGIEVIDPAFMMSLPGYQPANPVSQLVPGNTTGSRHCLQDTSTVDTFLLPDGFGPKYEALLGPMFSCTADTTVTHPTHGDVLIDAGLSVRIRYQRNLEAETARERRALD